MSLKSLIQIIILLIIVIILGGVYFSYFSNYNKLSLEATNVEIKTANEKNLPEEKEIKTANEKKLPEEKEVKQKTENKISEQNNLNTETNNQDKNSEEKSIIKKPQIKNLVKDVEYLTTDKKGNKYKLLAKSGKTNKDNNNILDLNNVRGFVTSNYRSTIYIVSDFAEYNSSNLNSKFYQNVVINYEDKEITCEIFEIDMETNISTAYNDVVVTDPKSIMKAGIITLDIETKEININPDNKINKVTVTTN